MKVYRLENLTCAHCAATIEERLGALECVSEVRLQFATSELHLATTDLAAVRRVVAEVEAEVKVVEKDEAPAEARRPFPWVLAGATAVWLLAGAGEAWGGALGAWAGPGSAAVLVLAAAAYLGAGIPVLRAAAARLGSKQWADEHVLMAVASLAAWVLGAGFEAASVVVFYQWGQELQGAAVDRSRRSLGALLAARPRAVRVVEGGRADDRDPAEVAPGVQFEVRAGETVPLDGRVVSGRGACDASALTGESLPRSVGPGDEVAAGSVNLGGVWVLENLRPWAETSWARMADSVEAALARKSPVEAAFTRFAQVYTPVVLGLAFVLFAGLAAFGMRWDEALHRSLVLLVISCPCALVVSIPLTYLGAQGAASRRGLLVRDPGALDRLGRVRVLACDKTGTLTEGRARLTALVSAQEGGEAALRSVLDAGLAASTHPLARSWFEGRPTPAAPEGAQEHRGLGTVGEGPGGRWAVGRASFLADLGFAGLPAGDDRATVVHGAGPGGYLGRAEFEDSPKAGLAEALAGLDARGWKRPVVLSGDVSAVVEAFGRQWGLPGALGGLKPEDKLAWVEAEEARGRPVLFVGDGLNDAPVLARATVGVSLGTGASAAAIQTADVAILDPSPVQVVRLLDLAARTRRILAQNIVGILAVKVGFLALGGLGLAGLGEAVVADVGVALMAVLNSLRTRG